MTQFSRRHTLALLAASTASVACTTVPQGVAGDDPFEGGIGGTGIVGVMVASGSVLINGLRVDVPHGTAITLNGARAGHSALTPGMAMTIVAQAHGGRFEAARIDVEHPLIGLVTHTGGQLRINGAALHVDQGAIGTPRPGQRMAASGVWRPDGGLQVSLIQPTAQAQDRVAGTVIGVPGQGWRVGQTPVTPLPRIALTDGGYTAFTGQYVDGVFVARQVQNGRFRAGTALTQLSVEGFLEPATAAPGFRVSGLGHSFARDLNLSPFQGQRSVFFGPYDGLFGARRLLRLPQGVAAREALLRPAADTAVAAALSAQARTITRR